MAIIKCKMCGGDMVLNEEKTFGTCEYCGSTMTLPKVSDDQRAARFNRGNHFRRQGEFDKALAVYESIVREDDNDAEAHWCCALCRFGIEYVEDPNTFEYLPTCHRASFDSFLEDVDYLAALEHSDGITRRQYQKDAAKIAEVQKGILATSQNEEPFDVFICYKETDDDTKERTRDSLDAQEIYYQLTQEGYRVFFSRITLEDKVGTEYEPYIFAALNSAKVMVALGSKPEYFNAVWVKNEWSRFLAMMRKDRSKLLLPCYKGMDPYDLPEQLGVLQSYDMSKIGFMQDLIRGIKKVLRKDEPKPVKETVVVQQAAPVTVGSTNLAAQLKRGKQALEDRDWNAATEFFDKALDLDAECADAFYGKALAEAHCATGEELTKKRIELPVTETQRLAACEPDTARVERVVKESVMPLYLKEEDLRKCFDFNNRFYSSLTSAWQTRIAEEAPYWERDRLMSRAVRFAKGDLARTLQTLRQKVETGLKSKLEQSRADDARKKKETADQYAARMDEAEQQAKQLRADAEAKRHKDYEVACSMQEKATYDYHFITAAEEFESDRLRGYLDSDARAGQCRAEIARLQEEKKQQKEKEEAEAEKHRKKNMMIGIIAAAIAVLAIAAVIIVTTVIIPNNKYNAAVKLYEDGKFEDAIAAFDALEGYKDSADRKIASSYQVATKLYEDGKYEEAIVAFEALNEYEDSVEQIKKCKTAISEDQYNAALDLYNAGKYDEARNIFIELDGYKDSKQQIRKCIVAPISTASIGESIFFGSFEQKNNSNGKQQIEWIVLAKEEGQVLLLSKYALRIMYYEYSSHSEWGDSEARTWLNEDFYSSSFTEDEKTVMQNTPDNVFLLSVDEVNKYLPSALSRKCHPTEKVKASCNKSRLTKFNGYCWWRLRSPSSEVSKEDGLPVLGFRVIDEDGEIRENGLPNVEEGIRPAIWIDIEL